MAGRSALYAIAEKLDHPLVEVRQRASNSLEFKVTHGLVSAADMLAVSSLLCVALNPAEYDCSPCQRDPAQEGLVARNLIAALKHADNGVLLDAALLRLVTQYAAHPSAARQLLHAGAEVVLHHRSVGCESQELLRLVEATRLALTGCPGRAGKVTATEATDQSNPGSAQYPQTTPRYSSPPGSSSPVVQNTPWPGPFQSPQGGDASYSQGAQSSYSPAPAAVMMSPPAAGGAMSHRRLQTPVPRASAWSPSPQQRQQQQQQQQRSRRQAQHMERSPSLPHPSPWEPLKPRVSQVGGSPTPGGHAVLVSKRIDRQRQAANLDREPGSDSGSEAVGSPEDWLLQPAPLGQSDDEALFEVALRLRHSTEPGIALPALQQLTHAWMADLPAEAIVVRHGILDSLLRILSDPGSSSETRQLAAAAVQQLLAGLVCSLATATDMRYQSASGGAAPTQRPTYPTRLPQCAATRAARGDADPGSRQSHAPAGLPPTDGEPLAPVNVSRIVFVVALTAFGLLSDPQRHPLLLPLVEQLLPLLLLGSSVGPAAVALGHALATNLAIARSEAASIVRAYEGSGLGAEGEGAGDGGTGALALVINRPCASILMLLGRILPTLPVDLWVSDVIPPAVTDSLATVCKDEVSCLLLPGLREAVAPVLTVLRPDLDLVLDLTRQVEAALGVAEELREQVAQLGSSRCATASSWLHKLHASMPALDLHADPALIQAAISGLSQICSAPAGGLDAGVGERACAMMLQLLTHRSGRVCSAVYALLEGMVQGMRDSSAGQPLVQQLLCAEGTLEHLVVSGLGDPRVEASVARILTQLLQWGDAACRACLHRWVFWVGQHAADPLVGALASSLAASHAAALQRLQPGSWDRLVPALRGLFGSGVGGRRAAAGELAVAVVQAGVYLTPEAGSHTGSHTLASLLPLVFHSSRPSDAASHACWPPSQPGSQATLSVRGVGRATGQRLRAGLPAGGDTVDPRHAGLASARTSLPLAAAAQLAHSLDPSSLLHLLANSYLQPTATASYSCRVTAGVVMAELLQLLQATATATDSQPSDQGKALDDSLASALSTLLAVVTKHSTPTASGTSAPTPNAPQHQQSLATQRPSTASATSVSAAVAATADSGGGVLQGQALLRVTMDCMVPIMALLSPGCWAATWQKVSGTFWLSRLCRHRDTRVRGRALQLLALLMGPGADRTQHMVAQGWPDCVDRMVDIVMDGSEQYCSRTAALHLLCGALAADPEGPHSSWAQRSDPATKPDNGSSRRQLFTSGSQALLRHPTFWDAAPSMLHDAAAPASFTRALQALMLQGLVLDADSFTPRLQQPGVPQRLLLLLQPESSAAGAHSAASCASSGGGGGGGGGDAGGPRFGVHGGGSRTGGSGAQDLDHSSVAGAASMCVTAFDDMPLRGVADSQSQGPTQTTGTGPAPSLESARPHKPTPGLVTSGNILASAGLAAQILSLMTHHAVDPSGPAADDSSPAGTTQGRLPAGVAAAATLTALWVMAAAVPEVEARGDAAVAAVAAVHVQHGVTLHQVADACAQLLQGLSQLELASSHSRAPPSRPSPTPLVLIPIQAASHVQQGRKRGAPTLRLVTLPGHRGLAPDHPRPSDAPSGPPHSRAGSDPTRVTCDAHVRRAEVILSVESRVRASQPLLVACCAALSSACVQQPAKLAVACLVSTLLAEAPTAKALLHATHSEYEHTLTSTGLTVGATLCQALDSLLPSQALCITSSVANPTTHRHHHHHQHSHQRPPHPSSSPSQKTDSRPVPFSAPPFENLGGPRSSRSPEPQHLSSLSPAHPHHTQRHSHNHSPPPGSHGTAANHSSNSAPGSAQSSAAAAAAVAAAAAAAAGVSQAQLHALQTVVPQGLQGEELVIIVAMRNLLAHSAGAKLHALRAGLHATLLRCCAAGAAVADTAAAAAAAAAAAGCAGRGFAASAAPAASPHAGSGGGGGGGGGGSGRTPLRPNPSVFASSPAEVRTPGSSGRATTAVANTPGSAVSAPRQQQPLAAAEQRQRLQVLDQKLTASLSLLKHLALASPTACSTLLHAHAVPTLRRLWRHAATATSGSVFHELLGLLLNLAADPAAGGCSCRAQLAGEGAPPLLKLITDMLFAPPSATLSPPTRGLLARLLACVASFEDGACLLVKSGDFLSQCCRGLRGLAASKSAPRASDTAHHIALITISDLRGCLCTHQLVSLSSVRVTARHCVARLGGMRRMSARLCEAVAQALLSGPAAAPELRCVLHDGIIVTWVLHNLAAHTEGQRCILRTPAAAGLTDVILSTLALPSASPPPLLNACLLLLRNLSFSAEARTHLLAHPGVLCAMVGHAERVAENPEGAAQAVSGLWALVHSGEKVKAALRRLPSCVQRLNAIAATADFTLTQLSRAADVAAANAHRQQQQQQQRQRQTGSDAGKSSARPKPNPSNLLLPRPHSHTAEGSQTPAWQNRVGAASMAEEGPGAAGMDAVDFVTRSHAQGLSAAAAGGIRSRDAEEWLLATAETVGALLEVMGATSLLGEGRDGGEAVQWAAAGGAWKQQRLQQQQQQQQQHDRSPLRDPLGGGRKPIVHGRPRDAWVDQHS
ncbi:MAG: hypothetical protein WDW38_009952 [Sanguina aurantia]